MRRSPDEERLAQEHGPEFLEVLARGLRVLTALGSAPRGITLADIAGELDLSRATARRVLHTLVNLGFVVLDGRLFRLTPKVLTLATAYLATANVPAVMQPIVERVSGNLQEACSAAVLDGDEIVFVARATPARILTVGLEIGYRLPASSTAVGRVLLSGLTDAELDAHLARAKPTALTDRTLIEPAALRRAVDDARTQGYAVADQEVERGFLSVAVPVRRRDERIVCAIHIGTHVLTAGRHNRLDEFLSALRAAAADAQPMLV